MTSRRRIPDEVWLSWSEAALENSARQIRHHEINQHQHPYEDCWRCGRQRAVCKTKIRFTDLELALDFCNDYAQERGGLMVPYRCYWSEGLHWHNKTAKSKSDRRRAGKQFMKYRLAGGK